MHFVSLDHFVLLSLLCLFRMFGEWGISGYKLDMCFKWFIGLYINIFLGGEIKFGFVKYLEFDRKVWWVIEPEILHWITKYRQLVSYRGISFKIKSTLMPCWKGIHKIKIPLKPTTFIYFHIENSGCRHPHK